MSELADNLQEHLGKAIDEWMATNGGGMVTAYAAAVTYYDSEGDTCWATAFADGQTPSQTLGLLRWHTLSVEHDVMSYFRDEDGDL